MRTYTSPTDEDPTTGGTKEDPWPSSCHRTHDHLQHTWLSANGDGRLEVHNICPGLGDEADARHWLVLAESVWRNHLGGDSRVVEGAHLAVQIALVYATLANRPHSGGGDLT